MQREERVAWACCALMLGIIGWSLGRVVPRDPKSPPQTLGSEVLLQGRIEALEARAEAQAKLRCFNVKTDRLDVAIFPVENLGVKK